MSIEKITKKIITSIGDDYYTCNKFMLDCLPLVTNYLPQVGIETLDIAKKFWLQKSIEDTELESVRIKCWNYLDTRHASTNIQDKEFCALKALICILYASPPSEDLGDVVEFFLKMILKVSNNIDYINNIVEKYTARNSK